MSLSVYVCVCAVCVCVCLCVYMWVYMCVCVHMCVFVSSFMCSCVHVCAYMCTCVFLCVVTAGQGGTSGSTGVADHPRDSQQERSRLGSGPDGLVGRALPHCSQQCSRPQW